MKIPLLTTVWLSFALAWISAACVATDPKVAAADRTNEEYAIYKLVIEEIAQPVESMPVLGQTVPNHQRDYESEEPFRFVQTSVKTLARETLEDFAARNKERVALEYRLDLPHGNVFITDEETSKVPSYPGFVELSRVGFDPTSTQALVYIGHRWSLAGFQGRGYYVVLDKQEGAWRITNKLVTRLP